MLLAEGTGGSMAAGLLGDASCRCSGSLALRVLAAHLGNNCALGGVGCFRDGGCIRSLPVKRRGAWRGRQYCHVFRYPANRWHSAASLRYSRGGNTFASSQKCLLRVNGQVHRASRCKMFSVSFRCISIALRRRERCGGRLHVRAVLRIGAVVR